MSDKPEASAAQKKRYTHIIDNVDEISAGELELFNGKIRQVITKPIKRVLFVSCPEIGREHFIVKSARQGVYPCFPPYGPGVMVAVLESEGFQTEMIDLHYEVLNFASQTTKDEEFTFDVWRSKLDAKIKDFQPDLIGISIMFNLGHSEFVQIAKHIRESFPSTPIVAGGIHPSLSAKAVLTEVPEIDFIILHEAENSFRNFLAVANQTADSSALTSIATRVEDRVMIYGRRDIPQGLQFSPDYKSLPIQDYSRVGRIGAYTFLRPREAVAATVISRRGCRAQCSFCSVRSVSGAGVRIRDHVSVVDEIQNYKEKYGVSHVMWLDDDLFYDNELSINLFKEMASRDLNMTWDASNGIIAAALNPELLDACVASGCVGFNIGIESGNPEILRQMRKPGTVEKFIEAAALLRNYPQIFTKGFLIVGYPGESLGAIQDSISLARAMDLDWYPSQILTPMPGTPVHQLMLDQEKVAGAPSELLNTSKTLGKGRTFSVGVTGEIRKREMNEKLQTRPFVDAFVGADMSRVPDREEISDVWLTMDYRINYEPILTQTDRKKLEKKKIMLKEIGERMTFENPLGTLFYGVTLERLGEHQEAKVVIERAERFLSNSEFWKVRFSALGIDKVLANYKMRVGFTEETKIIELSDMEPAQQSLEPEIVGVSGALPGRAGTLPN